MMAIAPWGKFHFSGNGVNQELANRFTPIGAAKLLSGLNRPHCNDYCKKERI